MSILEKDMIDIINIEGDKCILIITDHLKWEGEHFTFLKDKINLYLHYLETGQVYLNTPDAKGKIMLIKLLCKFPPKKEDRVVLDKIKEALCSNGMIFNYEVAI